MTGDQLYDYAKTLKSRSDFVLFVKRLNDDLKQNRKEWENLSLDSYLDGLADFASDMEGYYKNMNEKLDIEQMTWRMAAEMLLAASVYSR